MTTSALKKQISNLDKKIKKDQEKLELLQDQEKRLRKFEPLLNRFIESLKKEIIKDENFRNDIFEFLSSKNYDELKSKFEKLNKLLSDNLTDKEKNENSNKADIKNSKTKAE